MKCTTWWSFSTCFCICATMNIFASMLSLMAFVSVSCYTFITNYYWMLYSSNINFILCLIVYTVQQAPVEGCNESIVLQMDTCIFLTVIVALLNCYLSYKILDSMYSLLVQETYLISDAHDVAWEWIQDNPCFIAKILCMFLPSVAVLVLSCVEWSRCDNVAIATKRLCLFFASMIIILNIYVGCFLFINKFFIKQAKQWSKTWYLWLIPVLWPFLFIGLRANRSGLKDSDIDYKVKCYAYDMSFNFIFKI